MNMPNADRSKTRLGRRVIGIVLVAVLLIGLSACEEQAPADAPQVVETSLGQTGAIEREASTLSVSAGQSVTLTVTPANVGGFYAVRDDLNSLVLADHTADNYAEGVFIMLEAKPFSYTVTIPPCPAPGHEFRIAGEWWTEPGQPHPMPETTLVC